MRADCQYLLNCIQDLTDLFLRASALQKLDPVLALVAAYTKYGPARDALLLQEVEPGPVQPAQLYALFKKQQSSACEASRCHAGRK